MSMLVFQICFIFQGIRRKNPPEMLQNGFAFDGFRRKDLQTAFGTV
jgi:hypothetical protein